MTDHLPVHPLAEIKRLLEAALQAIVSPGSAVWYLDYPLYINPGDWLIFQATENYFRDYGMRVQGRFSLQNFSLRLRIPAEHTIVLHGGGNLGDLYPFLQMFREEVIRRYSQHRIVILPQTVYFQHAENLRQAQDVFGGHRNLTIMLRDQISFEFCSRHFSSNEIKLAPDMSHLLWPLMRPVGEPKGTLYLLRRDRERHSDQSPRGDAQGVCDWRDMIRPWQYGQIAMFRMAHYLDRILGNRLPVYAGWYDLVCALTERLIDLFSGYRCIVSSRLHGHLLACLLEKPNVLLDNSYGKNSAYFHTWTWQVPNASLGSFADVLAP